MKLPDKIEVAYYVAYCTHKGQKDKAGVDYINHCVAVHNYVCENYYDDEVIRVVALLHDVLEDTDFPESALRILFGDNVVDILLILRHNRGENYFDYIDRVKQNKIATIVKFADLKHNSNLSRLNKITDKDMERYEKYQKAIQILSGD